MNKKILAGTVALGVAVTFWACGSGEILVPTTEDETMSIDDPNVGPQLDPIMKDPAICSGCYGEVVESSSSRQTPVAKFGSSSSSLRELPTFSSVALSSSSSEGIVVNLSSSSSRFFPPTYSSSAQPPVVLSSSSATTTPPLEGDVGSCAPNPATIDANGQTTWKFTKGSAVKDVGQLLSASYAWTFEGGTPATASGTGANALSQSITYTTSGQHTASLVVTIGGSHYPVTCSPLQVNGAKITGCKCTAVNKKPDIALGEMGTWSVTGCTTTAPATITG